MYFVKLLPVFLSFLFLGMHFMRAGMPFVVILCASLPLLLFIQAKWVARLIQICLILGTIEWLTTLVFLVQTRQAHNQPWHGLALILGAISLFTCLSSLVFQSRSLKDRYQIGRQDSESLEHPS